MESLIETLSAAGYMVVADILSDGDVEYYIILPGTQDRELFIELYEKERKFSEEEVEVETEVSVLMRVGDTVYQFPMYHAPYFVDKATLYPIVTDLLSTLDSLDTPQVIASLKEASISSHLDSSDIQNPLFQAVFKKELTNRIDRVLGLVEQAGMDDDVFDPWLEAEP